VSSRGACAGLVAAAMVLAAAVPVADGARPHAATLTVFAAASLSGAFEDIGRAFERDHPEYAVRFHFAGSQQLTAQLLHGARADVFASADERWMAAIVDSGLVVGTPRRFALNRLVVIVPKTNPARLRGLHDLARRGVRVVLAADVVPAGRYARDALAKLGREPGSAPDYTRRVIANVVSQEENVRAVVMRVRLGEADAGFVYASDVTPPLRRALTTYELPKAAEVIARYPIAPLANAMHPQAARAFIDYVISPPGEAVLARHGFAPAMRGQTEDPWRPARR
jgi:molybdate transport system substrate-binding protein